MLINVTKLKYLEYKFHLIYSGRCNRLKIIIFQYESNEYCNKTRNQVISHQDDEPNKQNTKEKLNPYKDNLIKK